MRKSPSPLAPARAVVTAGAVRSPLGRGLFLTTVSYDGLASAITRALLARGLAVDLVASRALLANTQLEHAALTRSGFGSAAELADALAAAAEPPPALAFLTAPAPSHTISPLPPAAASSRARAPAAGDDDSPLVRLQPVSDKPGRSLDAETFVVGFTMAPATHAAHSQRGLDLLVACPDPTTPGPAEAAATDAADIDPNTGDLPAAGRDGAARDLGAGQYTLTVFTPEGDAVALAGDHDQLAEAIVSLALARQRARRDRVAPSDAAAPVSESDSGRERAAALLGFARDAALLSVHTGALSWRASMPTAMDPAGRDQAGAAPARKREALWVCARRGDPERLRAHALMPMWSADEPDRWLYRPPTPSAHHRTSDAAADDAQPPNHSIDAASTSTAQPSPEPAVDATAHAWLYACMPALDGLWQVRDALIIAPPGPAQPGADDDATAAAARAAERVAPPGVAEPDRLAAAPPGSRAAAEGLHRALARRARMGAYRGGPFVLRRGPRAAVFGLDQALLESWRARFAEARAQYIEHLDAIGMGALVAGDRPQRVQIRPIFADTRIIGVSATVAVTPDLAPASDTMERDALAVAGEAMRRQTDAEPVAHSLFLCPDERRAGLGDELLIQLERRGAYLLVHDRCEVLDYYRERGYRPMARAGAMLLLEPPTRRDDLAAAASVCLFQPVTRQVLLGRRLVGAWPGYWSFPGGRCEPGESALDTALRELTEETGVVIRERSVDGESRIHVGYGERAFVITTVRVLVFDTPAPTPSVELDSRWMSLDEALAIRPMGAGTKRVLRQLACELGCWPPSPTPPVR